MVTYGIVKHIDKNKTGLFIRGHANYVKKGPDIVCAAVSAIGQAAGLGAERFDSTAELKRNQNGYWMFVCDSTPETRAIIVTAISALDVLREQYPQCFAEPDEYTQSILTRKECDPHLQ